MIIEIIVATLLGVAAGIFTGLIPGIHTNTVSAGMLAMSAYFSGFSPVAVAAFILSMSVTNTFTDFIPSVFLGAPDAETALSVLPGHALLNEGKGYHAVKLTIVGGLGTFAVCLVSFPILFFVLKPIEPFVSSIIPYILLGVVALIIIREKDARGRVWGAIVFIFSGVLGMLTLNHLNINQPLFPMLSGLFGVSSLLFSSAREKQIPEQTMESDASYFKVGNIFNYIRAMFSALFVSVVPAIGAAEAATLALGFKSSQNSEDYLMIVGGIDTACSMFTLVVFYLIGKARSGSVAAVKEFLVPNFWQLVVLVVVCVVAALIAAWSTLKMAMYLSKYLWKINYQIVSYGIIGLLVVMALVMSGWKGLLVLAVSTVVGMLAPLANVKRTFAMGCLIIPVLSWYLF